MGAQLSIPLIATRLLESHYGGGVYLAAIFALVPDSVNSSLELWTQKSGVRSSMKKKNFQPVCAEAKSAL
jgi:hypothetical protein